MDMNAIELKPEFQFKILRSVWKFNWDEGFVFEGESHLSWEIVYVVSGCVRVTEDENVYNLREGDMIIHAPMEFHTICSSERTSPNVLVTALAVDGALPKNLSNGVIQLLDDEREEYKNIFERIFNFYHSEDQNPLVGQECIDSLSSFLIRMNSNHMAKSKFVSSRSAEEYKKIITSMVEHVYDNCTLEDIAAYNNTSVSNIKVLFRKYCGISPKLHYARLRCTEAIKLMNSGLSAAETADKLNFSSPNYFNTFFKRMTGKPPATFNRSNTDNLI